MKLSIVIVNYRAWAHLRAALDALQTAFPADWEIIVVDNESESVALEKFENEFPWVTWIANPDNSGFGFGCMIGVAAANGTQLLFMNPDVIAGCADIHALIAEKHRHPDVALLSPKQVGMDGRPQKAFDEFPTLLNQVKWLKALFRVISLSGKANPRAQHDDLVYCDWVTGSCLLIDRADFDSIGGWSVDYWMYVEDADLCRRAHNAGLRVAYTPEVQVIHAHGGSSRINVEVKSMTKLEVIISKHVYISNHMRGANRWLCHCLIATLKVPNLTIAAMLSLLSLHKVPALKVRSNMLVGLLDYYAGVMKTGSWISPRARANQA